MTFLVGGARSGKSALAVRLGAASGLPVVFVATAEAGDEETAERIARHQADRPSEWTTVEAPRRTAEAVEKIDPAAFVVLDCLTFWTFNIFDEDDPDVLASAAGLASALADRPGPSVAVSNEVGCGIVPSAPAVRRYRDLLGMVNAVFRRAASDAYLCAAGGVVPISAPPA